MKLITKEILAKVAAERWKDFYFNYNKNWGYTISGNSEIIYQKLIALGANPNPEDVDKIIGNSSWTNVGNCNECGETANALIEVGEEPNYESATARICIKCAKKAFELFD